MNPTTARISPIEVARNAMAMFAATSFLSTTYRHYNVECPHHANERHNETDR